MDFYRSKLIFCFLMWWTLVIPTSSTTTTFKSDRFVYESFVELTGSDSYASQAELRLACCESASDVATRFW